jgi:threonine/homoserine/homoserine lactone efflux protein
MSWAFVAVVLAMVSVPGVDFVITLRNTVVAGRGAGAAAALGIGVASVIQGTLVSLGLGALIVRSQPVFLTLKWWGIGYLLFLAVQALWSAWRGVHPNDAGHLRASPDARARALRQGFLGNITNPKMFVFYLFLLPQFVGASAPFAAWLVHAWTLPLIGTAWLLIVVVLGGSLREWLLRPLVRRMVNAFSGMALLGFGIRMAVQPG